MNARSAGGRYALTLVPLLVLMVPVLQWLVSIRLRISPWDVTVAPTVFLALLFAMGALLHAYVGARGPGLRIGALCNFIGTMVLAGLMLRFQPPFPSGIPAYEKAAFLLLAVTLAVVVAGALGFIVAQRRQRSAAPA